MSSEDEKDKKTDNPAAESTEESSQAYGKPTAGANEPTPSDVLKEFEKKKDKE